MRQNAPALCLALGLALSLGICAVDAANKSFTRITKTSLSIVLPSGEELVLYPPDNNTSVDTCPDAAWKQFKLHKSPPNYDPLNWTSTEWQDYLREYVLPTAGLSIAFFVIALIMMVVMLLWRLVQWCAGCGGCRRTCSVGAETPDWLGDRKHAWAKGWIYLLVGGVIAMVVWGMLALDAQLIDAFWRAVRRILETGDNISSQMEAVELALNTTVPGAVNNVSYAVTSTINRANLSGLVSSSLTYAKISEASSSALAANSTALTARVAEVVNATAVLAAQLAAVTAASNSSSGSGSGRHLLATTSSSSDYASLGALLAALTSGLPRLAAANSTTADMAARLRTLQAAAADVSAQLSSGAAPTADSLAALQAALTGSGSGGGGVGAPVGGGWSDQLGALLEGARAYEAARGGGGAVFNSSEALAQEVLKGAQGLLTGSALLESLTARVAEFRQRVCASPLSDIQALFRNFESVVNNTVDASTWTVRFKGKSTPFMELVDSLEGDVVDFFMRAACGGAANSTTSGSSGSGSGRRRLQQQRRALLAGGSSEWSLDSFIASIANGSATAASLNVTAATFAAAADAAEQAAAAGPSSASASTTVSTSLSPSLAAAAAPLASLSATLAAYVAGNATLAQLQAALDAASAPLANATSAFSGSSPLDPGGALQASATSLLAASSSLAAASTALAASLSSANATLAQLQAQSGAVGGATAAYADLVAALPPAASTTAQLDQVQSDVLSTVADVSTTVNTTSLSASESVADATDTLNTKVLAKGYNFEDDWQSSTQHTSNIVYGVWMGVYGLAALCLLVLVVAVWRNWPAGLLLSGLLLLVLVLVSQALCAAMAVGLALLDDACNNVEDVALREKALRDQDVPVSLVMSYYFYNKPSMADVGSNDKTAPIKTLIDAAFDVSFNDIISKASTVNTTLFAELEEAFDLRGETLSAVQSAVEVVFDSQDGLLANITNLLSMMHYDNINPLYVSAKNLFCCEAGTFAFNQWCAMTAAAAITFAALIAASYLLARMDMIGLRAGCCSCCTCACYRPANKHKQREEEAVDHAAKAALEKRGAKYAVPQQGQGLLAAAPMAAYTGGVAPAPPPGAEALPTGFMTAAGGAAAFAALAETSPAPSAPPPQQGVVAGYPYQPAPYAPPYTPPPMGK